MLNNGDGWNDLICTTYAGLNGSGLAIYHISWFENPGHTSGNPLTGTWTEHVIDALYGGTANNPYCNSVSVVVGDLNNDGHLDVVAADQNETNLIPTTMAQQIGDGLVWYTGPSNPRGTWSTKTVLDQYAYDVHTGNIILADFNGDGQLDICYGEDDGSACAPTAMPTNCSASFSITATAQAGRMT